MPSFQPQLPVSFPGPVTLLAAVAGSALVFTLRSQVIQTWLKILFSRAINAILSNCYPIKHVEKGNDLPSLPYVFPNGQGNVEKFLHGRANSAGWESELGPLYRLWTGMKAEIVLTKHAHVELVFRDSQRHTKARASNSGYLMDRLLGSCLGLISGSSWRCVKSGFETPFLHRSTSAYITDVQDFTKKYIRTLSTEDGSCRECWKLHPVHDLKLLPFFFVARIVYGPMDTALEGELKAIIPIREELFRSVIGGGITRFSFVRFLPLHAVRVLHDFKVRWAGWSDRAHAHALQAGRAKAAPIVAMYKCVEEGTMTREQLLQTLDEMLFANMDVTIGGISWTLIFLATHAAAQDALRSEIRQHPAVPKTAAMRNAYLLSSWTTYPTFLGACILESARLRPLAAFSVPQSCPTPRVLDGFEIPAGTDFIIDTHALNIRDPFWGNDRGRFRPHRWLERQKSGRDLRYRYWRFGFGPRTCLGKYVAELVLRSVVVELLENWHISIDTTTDHAEKKMGRHVRCDETGQEDMDWPWDDEMWIHHPDLLMRCEPLIEQRAS